MEGGEWEERKEGEGREDMTEGGRGGKGRKLRRED